MIGLSLSCQRLQRRFSQQVALGIFLALTLSACQSTGNPTLGAEPSAQQLIAELNLESHVEGGYFRRTYQADHRGPVETDGGDRFLMTSIFYLLTDESPVGHFHLNQSDIVHYYHLGDPIDYYLIDTEGDLTQVTLGHDVTQGHRLQLTVKGGVWKASRLRSGPMGYGLISEAVSPGFDFADMTLGDNGWLGERFPEHRALFPGLTRD